MPDGSNPQEDSRFGLSRQIHLPVDGKRLVISDDAYSDRVRCDHPELRDGESVGRTLLMVADALDRSRIVVLAEERLREGLAKTGFEEEATMPGFYEGERDCVVMGLARTRARAGASNPDAVEAVNALVRTKRAEPAPAFETRRATVEDAPELAQLLGETFAQYPTPSDDARYVAKQIEEGTPFRVVDGDGEIIACASADLVREAKTAELTDCATRPEARGNGLMRRLLADLMEDLRDMDYPTAFTLARARIPGINIAFARLGFELRGRMDQSCRIGDGLEDMNVWSRAL